MTASQVRAVLPRIIAEHGLASSNRGR